MVQNFKFDYATIRAAYDAGVRVGSDRATAFEWGSISHAKDADEIADIIQEALNGERGYGDEGYIEYGAVHKWVTHQEAKRQEQIHPLCTDRRADAPQDAADAQS